MAIATFVVGRLQPACAQAHVQCDPCTESWKLSYTSAVSSGGACRAAVEPLKPGEALCEEPCAISMSNLNSVESKMRITYERFGQADVVRVEDGTGPVKMLIGAQDQGVVSVLASGRIIHIPPGGAGEDQQAVVEFMQKVGSTMPEAAKAPMLSKCEALESGIARIQQEIINDTRLGIRNPVLQAELKALEKLYIEDGCG
jgi:hypothetical protein